MATFFNRATLSYGDTTINSNTTVGELISTVAITKEAMSESYSEGETVTYVVRIDNNGQTAYDSATLTDDLGAYPASGGTLYPLTYIEGSVRYYINGVSVAPPTVGEIAPLVFTGLNLPAGGNGILIYSARVNEFAPLVAGSSITNTATLLNRLSDPVSDSSTINVFEEISLTVAKAICPEIISENGLLTYTFVIQNRGNKEAVATDNVIISDRFDPILYGITVKLNGNTLTPVTDYVYSEENGEFRTTVGTVTVPAATYFRDENDNVTVNPGVAVITVTGRIGE